MTVTAIEKKAKLITGRDGKPVEVILPYNIYKELLELERSMEIFDSGKHQKGKGRYKVWQGKKL